MSSPSSVPLRSDVTVLGCGLMGSSLIRVLAAAGHDVVAWNRTHERAASLAGEHVVPAPSVADAVRASPLVIACLSTYESVQAALEDVDLNGRALVNLTSGAPDGAAELSAWATSRGAEYLDGAIIAFPDFIGSPEAILAYSGSLRVWDDHGELLRCLGGQSQWIGAEPRAAKVFDGSVIASFYTTAISAYVEAATYALDYGVPDDLFRAATRLVLRTLGHSTKEAAAAIQSGDFSTNQAKLSTYAIGTQELLQSMQRAGQPARILTATVESLDAACAAGYGEFGIYAQAAVNRVRAHSENSGQSHG